MASVSVFKPWATLRWVGPFFGDVKIDPGRSARALGPAGHPAFNLTPGASGAPGTWRRDGRFRRMR
eukprot:4822556-Pyramimonas_sp.AAC.1